MSRNDIYISKILQKNSQESFQELSGHF